jgi:transcriptional regulator with XRE-family HTH domain
MTLNVISRERGGEVLLKKFRKNRNLTQDEVAKRIKVSLRQYQRIEAGESFPRESTLVLLEDLFQVPHRILFAKTVDEIPHFLKRFLY